MIKSNETIVQLFNSFIEHQFMKKNTEGKIFVNSKQRNEHDNGGKKLMILIANNRKAFHHKF